MSSTAYNEDDDCGQFRAEIDVTYTKKSSKLRYNHYAQLPRRLIEKKIRANRGEGCKTTSFVNQYSVMTPVSQFIRTNCFIPHKIVQYMVWVMQY